MKKLMLRLAGAVACICTLISGLASPITISAKELNTQIEPRLTYIMTYDVQLSISDNGVATVLGTVMGRTGVTKTSVKVTLQKSVSGTWSDVESWEASNEGRSTSVEKTYQVSRGTYRVVMTCSANSESKSATSATKTY